MTYRVVPIFTFNKTRLRARGFTLIETMVVLLVIGLLTVTITLSMTRTHQRAQLETVIASIKHYDKMLRLDASQFGEKGFLKISKDTGTFKRIAIQDDQKISSIVGDIETYHLPAGYKITRYWVNPQWQVNDDIKITASPLGHTQTYGIEIRGPEQEPTMLLFVGVSGQCLTLYGDRDIDANLLAIKSCSNY